jgi:uncharacterized protein YbaR (Trm112 family)
MYIELIDLLRCPREHADSWLVAAFNRMDGRFVVEGKLGCPVCSASYRIRNGVADLRSAMTENEIPVEKAASSADETAMRAAALLGLTKPNALVVLAGTAAAMGQQVSDIAEARVVAVNPATRIEETERVAVILADTRLPFAPSSVDGIMLDEATTAFASDASRVLRQGGRLIAPRETLLPRGFRELAKDDKEIVAESIGELISLSR